MFIKNTPTPTHPMSGQEPLTGVRQTGKRDKNNTSIAMSSSVDLSSRATMTTQKDNSQITQRKRTASLPAAGGFDIKRGQFKFKENQVAVAQYGTFIDASIGSVSVGNFAGVHVGAIAGPRVGVKLNTTGLHGVASVGGNVGHGVFVGINAGVRAGASFGVHSGPTLAAISVPTSGTQHGIQISKPIKQDKSD